MPEAFTLPAGWGAARLVPPGAAVRSPCAAAGPAAAGAPRAYDHEGAMLEWSPGPANAEAAAVACDLEHVGRFAGEADPARTDPRLSVRAWVATEVLAKLANVPILAFVRDCGVADPGDAPQLERALPGAGSERARLWLAVSADGRHVACFGMRCASLTDPTPATS
ncbi:MAG TPA: hypothetical protein VMH61_08110 [Candidatus Acidoferrales bacterium]|nr:hypothetical protein [Candidatus Acidoferrales bacterium]